MLVVGGATSGNANENDPFWRLITWLYVHIQFCERIPSSQTPSLDDQLRCHWSGLVVLMSNIGADSFGFRTVVIATSGWFRFGHLARTNFTPSTPPINCIGVGLLELIVNPCLVRRPILSGVIPGITAAKSSSNNVRPGGSGSESSINVSLTATGFQAAGGTDTPPVKVAAADPSPQLPLQTHPASCSVMFMDSVNINIPFNLTVTPRAPTTLIRSEFCLASFCAASILFTGVWFVHPLLVSRPLSASTQIVVGVEQSNALVDVRVHVTAPNAINTPNNITCIFSHSQNNGRWPSSQNNIRYASCI
eukprot:m.152395 g.152395  ORF g.152395 m.152395 type:complete len:306 (+) comp30805_c1_seq2:1561-2478(+)